MAHKGAYVTNLNEFINSANQRYHHKRYIQQLQYLLQQHSRNRRCLPDPSIGIHSKQAKRPLPTSPCFQQQSKNQQQIIRSGTPTIQQDLTKLNTLHPGRPVSPGRLTVLSSPRSRSRCSSLSRAVFAGSALGNLNTITCFSNSPQPPHKSHKIPTVIITSEGNKTLLNTVNRTLNNMAPSSVHNPVNRTSNNVPTTSTNATNVSAANQAATNSSSLRKVTFKLPPSNNNHNHQIHQNGIVLQQQERTRSAPPLYRSISESSLSLVQVSLQKKILLLYLFFEKRKIFQFYQKIIYTCVFCRKDKLPVIDRFQKAH